MSLSRIQLRHRSVIDSYKAEIIRPPSRKQARAWLAPIRSAFNEIKSGEVDSHQGYAITRIKRNDDDFARIDHCINGFIAMIERLAPEFDLSAMRKVGKKLEVGILLTHEEVESCFKTLNGVEDLLIGFSRQALKDAAQTEQIKIEFERMGIAA